MKMMFTYKCTNCRSSNKTTQPPEDCMLYCWRCGCVTVQYFHEVSTVLHKVKFARSHDERKE